MEGLTTLSIEWGAAEFTLPGQRASGDRHLVKCFPDGAFVAVVDGVGHGKEAAAAAEIALEVMNSYEQGSLIGLLKECHDKLRGTRGVVMSVAYFNALEETVTWLGVGNVEGALIHSDAHEFPSRETLLLRGGVIGDLLPRLHASIIPVTKGDLLIFATDGLYTDFAASANLFDHPQALAERIMGKHLRKNDDALVLVVRYLDGHRSVEPR